jgi:hypothetical protein
MTNEEWAKRILEKELRRDVILYDDNSLPGMCDLCIGSAESPEMAIECVGAVDKELTETWNVGPARDPLRLSTMGDWEVVITKDARVNKIKQRVERILLNMEDRGIYNVCANHSLKPYDEELFNELKSLGITHAYCFRRAGTGEVHLGMRGISGTVDNKGAAVPRWISEFLNSPDQKDVLSKLDKSGASECHVFVSVVFGGAPWAVQSYLSGNLEHLPVAKPKFPPPVTGVWIASLLGSGGIRWDGVEWRSFKIHNVRN